MALTSALAIRRLRDAAVDVETGFCNLVMNLFSHRKSNGGALQTPALSIQCRGRCSEARPVTSRSRHAPEPSSTARPNAETACVNRAVELPRIRVP